MSDRRSFLTLVGGASIAALSCSRAEEVPRGDEDPLETALRELNQAAGIGIAPEDFELARDYAAGAYREAQAKLRPLALEEGSDLAVAFSARRASR